MEHEPSIEEQLAEIRGRTAEIIPEDELARKLERAARERRPLRVKYGIDPTNPDIHIGHLVPCRVIRAFQDLGHTAVLIVGDYTARIGDPTGRNAERPPLDEEAIARNMERYAAQLFTVVDESRAELHYQSSWFAGMHLADTLRLLASFSTAQMLSHETFRARLDGGNRLSLHELLYPVLQAYDSLQIQADVEIGGTDQRFNCLCGRDLQRNAGEEPQVVVTVPLLPGADGRKMSKSLGNHIPLAASADEAVGRVMAVPDELIETYARLTTGWSIQETDALLEALRAGTLHPRDAKLRVARAVAASLRGTVEADRAVHEFERVFSRGGRPAQVEQLRLEGASAPIIELLVDNGLAASRSEARRLVAQGAVSLDGVRVTAIEHEIALTSEPQLLRVGKRRFRELTKRTDAAS
ncbi:MAG: tyrosine--tRNA ligase [Spirochaetota bacterium]